MAKTKVRIVTDIYGREHPANSPKGSQHRKIPAGITMSRSWDAKQPFFSCVLVGASSEGARIKRTKQYCAVGKNPRDALSAALNLASIGVKGRRGAFARLKQRKRRR